MLKDTKINALVRANIAGTLGGLGERSIVPDLMAMLKNTQIDDLVGGVVAVTLGELGEKSIVPDLMKIFENSSIARLIYRGIAIALGKLGEKTVIPALVETLENSQSNWFRIHTARTLGNLAEDKKTMRACFLLLSQTSANVADAIYSALWDMSRRAEVTIVVPDDGGGKEVEFVPWQNEAR